MCDSFPMRNGCPWCLLQRVSSAPLGTNRKVREIRHGKCFSMAIVWCDLQMNSWRKDFGAMVLPQIMRRSPQKDGKDYPRLLLAVEQARLIRLAHKSQLLKFINSTFLILFFLGAAHSLLFLLFLLIPACPPPLPSPSLPFPSLSFLFFPVPVPFLSRSFPFFPVSLFPFLSNKSRIIIKIELSSCPCSTIFGNFY